MKFVNEEITVFTDANTMISPDAVREIVHLFKNDHVGCIAGEKKINLHISDKAVTSGEGFYWKYESLIKYLESSVNSSVGAAGELFAIRTSLFEDLEENTILDDFELSLRIALKGYKIKYSSKAFASEDSSLNIKEEMKRKVRIAAGSFQTLFRLHNLLNPFKAKFLSFQFISHKLLRWVFVPIAFVAVFFSNLLILLNVHYVIYDLLFYLQCLFYLLVIAGVIFQNYYSGLRFLFLPYYLFIMNLSIIKGMIRYFTGNQKAQWEKAQRADTI
jgi:poly-beta-1,6-N-acetyl-D-glucosamine synthase